MIVTVTCNPAIDKTISDDNTTYTIGGKGINVSKALNNLNTKSLVTGFLGKDNKDLVLNDLDELKLKHKFVLVDGKVRTNTKRIIDNKLYEENEDGPFVDEKALKKLKDYLHTYRNSTIVISGSIPSNVDCHYYEELILDLKKYNYVILDCDRDHLKYGIEALPNCIKPNRKEICDYFNIEYDEQLLIEKCKELIDKGIELIVVSLEDEGSLFINKDNVYKVNKIECDYVSSLCAGDSMVAGLAYGRQNDLDIIETIKLSVACASASVQTVGVFDDINEVERFKQLVEIEII